MLLDNRKNGRVGDELKKHLTKDAELSCITDKLSIFGFDALKEELTTLKATKILLSNIDKGPNNRPFFRGLAGDDNEYSLKNKLNQRKVAEACLKWLSESADVRISQEQSSLNQNVYHTQNTEGAFAVQGSSSFTTVGLGYTPSTRFEMNMGVTDAENTKGILEVFDSLWNDPRASIDGKDELLKQLQSLTEDKTVEFIYYLTLYNLFSNFIDDLDEDTIIKSKTGIKDSVVWNKLYRFQRDGVLGAIDKIERYNGCIIADSVGLGKTFEALAVIKYYELRNDRVLVLCPKKLRDNWTIYTVNDRRNLLAADRFNYDVLNHTDLTRTRGKSGEINLETVNWGNYDLVVIDESHNFRNANSEKEGLTRYSRLMNEIVRSGVKTKVLMLSATPVNNRMNDLKNQVAFITEGIDDLYKEQGITSIEQTLKIAQTQFNNWLKQPEQDRTLDRLLDALNFNYFKLLDILTIARSRKHIEQYYDTTEIGKFPERLTPLNIKSDIDDKNEFPPLEEINKTIRRLHLSAYSPLKYVRLDKREEYSRKYDIQVKDGASVFKQVDREQSLIHLMRVNLLKRMESSINSFTLTTEKLLHEVEHLLDRINNHNSEEIEELGIEDIEVESGEFDAHLIGKKVKVLIKDIDEVRWRQDLAEDQELLQEILNSSRLVTPNRDAKLNSLKNLIFTKVSSPINEGNKKVIVFTAFADTATYLYENIVPWVQSELGLHAALVTGSGTNKTTLKGIRTDLNAILTWFSPKSKERDKVDPSATDQIDILFATDCISEGQNLQDCDYLVNYDIHWNPVRIIQRFGRIDRLGSTNGAIQLVNFWPNMELDEYINLEARVSGRMVLLDISATGEENVIEQDESGQMNDLEYRRKQLLQLQNEVVDLEDLSGGVSITDLTLNDFRMDLSAYLKENRAALEMSPTGLYSVTGQSEELLPGVIFCLKSNKPKSKKATNDDSYGLYPYYLIYMTENGEAKLNYTQAKKILDLIRKSAAQAKDVKTDAVQSYQLKTKDEKDLEAYQALLQAAHNHIRGKSEEKGVDSLFSRGGTSLSGAAPSADEFELISYLVVV